MLLHSIVMETKWMCTEDTLCKTNRKEKEQELSNRQLIDLAIFPGFSLTGLFSECSNVTIKNWT